MRQVPGQAGEGDGARAHGDDRVLELHPRARPGAVDAQLVRALEAAGAGQHLQLAALRQPGEPVGELAHHGVPARPQACEVELRCAELDAGRGELAGFADDLGHVEQRLRGDAADVETDPPEHREALHQHHALAEVGGAKRCGVAPGARAEHEDVGPEPLPGRASGRRGGGRRRGGRRRTSRLGGGLGLRLGRRGGARLVARGRALNLEQQDRRALAHAVALGEPQLDHDAGLGRGNLHRGLVALEGDQGVLGRDPVARRHQHLDDLDVAEVPDVGYAYEQAPRRH